MGISSYSVLKRMVFKEKSALPVTSLDNVTINLFLFFSFLTEKLYNSIGRELRRALFSLKQIFQVIL